MQKIDALNSNYFKQYNLIKDGAFRNMRIYENVFNQIKDYNEAVDIKNNYRIHQRKKQFNELEFKVYTIKQNVEEVDLQINKIKCVYNTKDEEMKLITSNNESLLKERNILMYNTLLNIYIGKNLLTQK